MRNTTKRAPIRRRSTSRCLSAASSVSRFFRAPRHGYEGDGDGAIVRRGFPHPPSYYEPKLMQAQAQLFFDTITNGFSVMYSYGSRVPPHDRWAIAAYIRALQQSRSASLAEAPEAAAPTNGASAGGERP